MSLGCEGFSGKTFEFLHGLRDHNSKEWFNAHRQDYQRVILSPMQALVEELSPLMLEIDDLLEVSPTKAISRIYRDIRFSKDKSPYRINQWITFKRPRKKWQNHPAYFFEISPQSYRFGMGFYSADRATMDRFRSDLDENSENFLAAIAFFNKSAFILEGESYKRPLRSEIPSVLQDWYNRKSLYLTRSFPVEQHGISEDFFSELAGSFKTLAPLYHYLSKVIEQ